MGLDTSRLLSLSLRSLPSSVDAWLGELPRGLRPFDHVPSWAVVARFGAGVWGPLSTFGRMVVRFVALHTGLPALLVSAALIVVGYRVLKRTARVALEIAAIAATLLVATELGWIRW